MLVLGRIEIGAGMEPPRLAGSGLEVHRLLAELAERGSLEALLASHPELAIDDVRAVLVFAGECVEINQIERSRKATSAPQALRELAAPYSLPLGRCVARFTPPFPAARHWFAFARNPAATGDGALCLALVEGELTFEGASYSVSDPNTTALDTLIARVCSVGKEEIEGDPCLLPARVAGDFIFRAGAVLADRLHDLTPLLEQALGFPVRLSLDEKTRPVLVARGLARVPGEVQLYSTAIGVTAGAGSGSGDLGRFIGALGEFLGRRMADEVAEPRPGAVGWRYHHHRPCAGPAGDPAAVALVLDRVTEQTGIHVTEELRPVRIVTVSSLESSVGRPGS